MFKFSNYEYGIKEAYLDAYIQEHGPSIKWGFEIKAERENNEEDCCPTYIRVSIQDSPSFSSQKNTIAHWKDLVGTKIELKEEYEDDSDVLIYLDEHVPLTNGYFEIYTDSSEIVKIRIIGYSDSLHGLSKKLEIDTPIEFKGILCGHKNKRESFSSLKGLLNKNDYYFIKDASNVSLLVPKET